MSQDNKVRQRTIPGLLKQGVARFGNRTFLHFQDQVFGFEDLDRWSDRTAAGFRSLGLKKGDKTALMLGNRPEFLFLWFGLCKLGAVEVPLNVAHRGSILSYMLERSDCRAIVTEAPLLPLLVEVLPELPKLETVVVLDAAETDPNLAAMTASGRRVISYDQLTANDGVFEPADVIWSDPFSISFTSGTTGPSKGALMPHNYAVLMADLVNGFAEYTQDDRLYNALPLFHGNAQLLSTLPALQSGARMILAPRFSAGQFWPDIKKYGCTAFNYIGIIPPILLAAPPRSDDADNPLRVMFGAGCPPELFDVLEERFGVKLIEGYGLSELGLPLANSVRERKVGSIGRVVAGYQVKLVDDNGEEVGPGVPGEVLVRGDQPFGMMLEYYRNPAETVETWRDLWFHTGDLAVRDEDGFYRFVDRKKDALRRRGENISSWEVEKIISGHPAVAQVAAIAAKSDLAEDEVMVCVVRKPGVELAPEALLDFCRDKMANFMVPRYVRFMDQLPQTPTLRVQKAVLRSEGLTPDAWDREAAGYMVNK
ncbi:MAG: AMP-binding protein [Pseudomonadota bacterium]